MPVLPDPIRDKTVYELKEKEKMSFRDIHKTLRISLGGVHKMYHRHKAKLPVKRSRFVAKVALDGVHAKV